MRGQSQKARWTPKVILWLRRAQAFVHAPPHEHAYTRAHTCKHNTKLAMVADACHCTQLKRLKGEEGHELEASLS